MCAYKVSLVRDKENNILTTMRLRQGEQYLNYYEAFWVEIKIKPRGIRHKVNNIIQIMERDK